MVRLLLSPCSLIFNGDDSDRNLKLIFGRNYLDNIGRGRLQDHRAAIELQSFGLEWYERGRSSIPASLEAGSIALNTVNRFYAGTLVSSFNISVCGEKGRKERLVRTIRG